MKNPFGERPIEAANDNDIERPWLNVILCGVAVAVVCGAIGTVTLGASESYSSIDGFTIGFAIGGVTAVCFAGLLYPFLRAIR